MSLISSPVENTVATLSCLLHSSHHERRYVLKTETFQPFFGIMESNLGLYTGDPRIIRDSWHRYETFQPFLLFVVNGKRKEMNLVGHSLFRYRNYVIDSLNLLR